MKRSTLARLALPAVLLASAVACNNAKGGSGGGSSTGPVELKTDEQKAFYALGAQIGKSIGGFSLTPQELEIVKKGISDQVTGAKLEITPDQYQAKLQELHRARSQAISEKEKAKGKEFAEKAAKEPGAVKTDSGLVYQTIKPGAGDSPKATDRVKVHYHGTLIDGTVFDSSVKRGEPAEFPLDRVVPCWTEGVQKMKVGEKAKLICPSSIAYGDRGSPPTIPGGATLIFEVELLEIKK